MDLIKKQEFNKEVNGEDFIVTLEYGMKDDKSNHVLKVNIVHVLDKKTGKKATVYQDNIVDITHIPSVYEETNLSFEEALTNIKGTINNQINMIINSRKNQESMEKLIDELYKEGL